MATCPGSGTHPYCPGEDGTCRYRLHCPHCRDAAPPVLTEEEHITYDLAVGWINGGTDKLMERNCVSLALIDMQHLLNIIDRLTGGAGGSPI